MPIFTTFLWIEMLACYPLFGLLYKKWVFFHIFAIFLNFFFFFAPSDILL